MCYMVPVGRGVRREYQDMFRSFTCCVGTGMESHALHGYGIYYESGDRLWVNLYVPSTANGGSPASRSRWTRRFPRRTTPRLTVTVEGAEDVDDRAAASVCGRATASSSR